MSVHVVFFLFQGGSQGTGIFVGGLILLARQAGFPGPFDQCEIIEDYLLAGRKPARIDEIPFPGFGRFGTQAA